MGYAAIGEEVPMQGVGITETGTCLVVDDNSFDRHMVMRMLGRERPDLRLHSCETIAQARDYLKVAKPDMILLDHRLPDGQGTDFARELKTDTRLAKTVICVVTGTDLRLLDPDVVALSKDDLSPQALWEMVDAFLVERALCHSSPEGKLLADFGQSVQETLAPSVARMLRCLRRVKALSRPGASPAASMELDRLEEMLLALADVGQTRH
jgi:CheY-like chemotaxis protein